MVKIKLQIDYVVCYLVGFCPQTGDVHVTGNVAHARVYTVEDAVIAQRNADADYTTLIPV